MEETKELDLDLGKIIYMLRSKIVFILLITIFGGIAAGAFTQFFIDPTYSATVKFYVQNSSDTVSTSTSINPSELDAAEKLVNFCIYVIKTDTVLDKVAQDVELSSNTKLKSMITTTPVENTMAFQVTVRSKDPNLSAKIANSIAKIAPEEIVRIVNGGGVSVIDYAKVPKKPSSPNKKKNILIGALAGFIVSFAAFFIYEVFDTTITNAKDLERVFDIPILGTIPKLESVEATADNSGTSSDRYLNLAETAVKPSSTILENIQSIKEDAKDE
jgi:capsular polysaccharide biosynthesis protein